jgi:phospholipid/cholesterol/gamma-HCH transport system substrate-binding protein
MGTLILCLTYKIKIMKTETTQSSKIKLGVFVSITIMLFIVMIYFIGKRQQLFSNTFRVSGIFFDITGLQVGNNVRFSGINVGIIENIQQVTDSTVRVDMLIMQDTRKFIKKNAVAIIGSDGLMGGKLVLILPGTTGREIIANNDTLETVQAVTMDEILLSLKMTTDNAANITENLAVIMTNMREGRGTIGKLLMDSVMAADVDRALINIKQGAGGFKQNMDAAGHNFLLKGYLKKKEAEKNKIPDKP